MATNKPGEREREFWRWFAGAEKNLLGCDDPDDPAFHELAERLGRVHDGLVWEITPAESTPRELVISADGIVDNVDAVERLCDVAPKIKGWKFVRFRPRAPIEVYQNMRLDFGKFSIDARDVEVALYPLEEGVIGVHVFLRGCKSEGEESMLEPAFILLDIAIGEYDVMCKAGPVEVRPGKSKPLPGFEKVPYTQLREEFDALFESMHSA